MVCVNLCVNLNIYTYMSIYPGVSMCASAPALRRAHLGFSLPLSLAIECVPRRGDWGWEGTHPVECVRKGQRDGAQHHGQQARQSPALGTEGGTFYPAHRQGSGMGVCPQWRPLLPPVPGCPLVTRGREMRCFSSLSQRWANHREGDLLFRYSCSSWRLYT